MKTLLRVLPSDKWKSVYIVSNNMSMLNKKLLEIWTFRVVPSDES